MQKAKNIIFRFFSFGLILKYGLICPYKLKPDFLYKSVEFIDIKKLKDFGIKYVVFDKDNTITLPLKNNIHNSEIQKKLELFKKNFGKNNIGIFSNSIFSKKQREFINFTKNCDIPIIEHSLPKPYGGNSIFNHFGIKNFSKNNKEIAIIGDRLFIDVLMAKQYNFISVLIKPIDQSKDSITTKIIKIFELIKKKN